MEATRMNTAQIQYVADQQGKPTAVIVPIEVWQKILAEKETAYLLKSKTMKKRLLAAKGRKEGIKFGEAFAKLGI
jgi:antitoxin YefM